LVGVFIFEKNYKMVRNILAVILGLVIGSAVNMGLIIMGGEIFPLKEGFDPMNAMNWDLNYFLFPFLAHAIGTLAGAIVSVKIAVSNHKIFALSIGGFFLIGGIIMVQILPAPLWFILLDLIVAYIPMGYLGYKLIANKA
jgi:hypothetical protein